MERLKGKRIIIGKNPNLQVGNLMITVDGYPKPAVAGQPGSVPGSVSRCHPGQGMGHASVEIDFDGNMIVRNMKPENFTYVNGTPVVSKAVKPNTTIELGMHRHPVSLGFVLEAAKKIVGGPGGGGGSKDGSNKPVKKYNIKHLEYVWQDYHQYVVDLQKEQANWGNLQRVPMFFTLGSGALAGLAAKLEWPEEVTYICSALTIIGFILMIWFFFKGKKNDFVERREKATEDFQERYLCPNPECNRFLGNHSYKFMKKQYGMKCPYCKSEFVEN